VPADPELGESLDLKSGRVPFFFFPHLLKRVGVQVI